MFCLDEGESPGSKLMEHIINGGRVPEHLMDIPFQNMKCDHDYKAWEDQGFTGIKCTKCGRGAMLNDDEKHYLHLSATAFEEQLTKELLLERK